MAEMQGERVSRIRIVKGDNLRLLFELRDEAGHSVISQGASDIRFAVSPEYGTAPVISKALSSGTVVQSGPYTFYVDLLPADTATQNAGLYRYEVEVTTSGGQVYTCMQSDFTILPTSI